MAITDIKIIPNTPWDGKNNYDGKIQLYLYILENLEGVSCLHTVRIDIDRYIPKYVYYEILIHIFESLIFHKFWNSFER